MKTEQPKAMGETPRCNAEIAAAMREELSTAFIEQASGLRSDINEVVQRVFENGLAESNARLSTELRIARAEIEAHRGGKFDDSWARQCEENWRLELELSEARSSLQSEQQAHEQIVSLCFAAGAESGDGTSVAAVRSLTGKLSEARAEMLKEMNSLRIVAGLTNGGKAKCFECEQHFVCASEVYRCAECSMLFHRHCIRKHFEQSAAESIPDETLTDELATALNHVGLCTNDVQCDQCRDAFNLLARYKAMKGKQ